MSTHSSSESYPALVAETSDTSSDNTESSDDDSSSSERDETLLHSTYGAHMRHVTKLGHQWGLLRNGRKKRGMDASTIDLLRHWTSLMNRRKSAVIPCKGRPFGCDFTGREGFTDTHESKCADYQDNKAAIAEMLANNAWEQQCAESGNPLEDNNDGIKDAKSKTNNISEATSHVVRPAQSLALQTAVGSSSASTKAAKERHQSAVVSSSSKNRRQTAPVVSSSVSVKGSMDRRQSAVVTTPASSSDHRVAEVPANAVVSNQNKPLLDTLYQTLLQQELAIQTMKAQIEREMANNKKDKGGKRRRTYPGQYVENTAIGIHARKIAEENPEEEKFCICHGVSFGDMIGCDSGDACAHAGWFHYACVGITEKPDGDWLCPSCDDAAAAKEQ
jgi:hypothetical protein